MLILSFMNKCWAFDIKPLSFSAQFFWFKLPLIMSGCWNKRVGSSYHNGVMSSFSNSRMLLIVFLVNSDFLVIMRLVGSRRRVYKVWNWLEDWIGKWDCYWLVWQSVRMMRSGYKSRTCGLVIYLKEATFGLYCYVVVNVLDDVVVGLMCQNSHKLNGTNGYEICWRTCHADSLALGGMDRFGLFLGFSEQLGNLNRFVLVEILVIGGGFYFRLNSKLGMVILVVDMDAPVIDVLNLRLWYVFGFSEFWWLRKWLSNCFQEFCLASCMRSFWMLVLEKCGEGARAKVHRNLIRLIYDMDMIGVLMYFKICFSVAHFLNFWSYTIFVKGTKIVRRWVWQCLNIVLKE